jgi:hypothetical protein
MAWLPALIVAAVVAVQDQRPAPTPSAKEPTKPARTQTRVQTKDNASSKKAPLSQKTAKSPAKSQPGEKASERRDQKPPAGASPGAADRSPAALGPDDVEVRSLADMQKPKSEFLIPPGSDPKDRYSPTDNFDWNAEPPWRRASFFGIRERGLFFVYVVDSSGSMIDEARMPRATMEVRRSVMALQPPQRFEVIFYNHESHPMPGGPTPRTADLESKNLLFSWLRLIEPDGGTDPRVAVRQALGMKPDAVFLLSDGAFPDGTVDEITRFNKHRIPIHCVDLTGGLAGDHLKRIAAANGGRFVPRPLEDQGRNGRK